MLKNNHYFYEDEYMYFTFNQRHSSIYNLTIVNDKGTQIFIDRGSKIETTQPQYQSGQYMLGVSHPQRSFPLKLFGSDLTEAQIAEILNWIYVGATGALSFDYSSDWEYNVVVSALKNPVQTVAGYNLFNIELDITFVTLNTSLAKNKNDGVATITTDSNEVVYSNFNNKYHMPVYTAIPSIQNNYTCLTLKTHCLGDDKIEIGFIASDNISNTEFKYVELQTNDINAYYTKASLIGRPGIDTKPIVLEYSAYNNMFLVNNYIGEEYIKSSGILQDKTSETQSENQYSHFIYNKQPLSFMSPGEPVLLTEDTNIGSLLTTPYNWFICIKTKAGSIDLPYYITQKVNENIAQRSVIYYDTDFSGVDFQNLVSTISSIVNSVEPDKQVYFGFYQNNIINTNFNTISPIVTQYKYKA